MTVPAPPRIVVAGLAASLLVGAVECVYAFSIGSGLTGFGPSALFCLQVLAWTIAATAPVILVVHIGREFSGSRWRLVASSLKNPRTDIRGSIWVATLGGAFAVFVTALFVLAEHHLIGKRARGASSGTFVITAAVALVVLATVALLIVRLLLRHAARYANPSPMNPPRTLLAIAGVGAVHAALISRWLTSSLEVGFGIDLRIVIVPVFFLFAWSVICRLLATNVRRPQSLDGYKLRVISMSALVVLVSAGLLSVGQRADADAALLARSFIPRIMLTLLHSSNAASPTNAWSTPEAARAEPADPTDTADAPPARDDRGARETAASKFPSARPNIVLITIDTLRADHLGAYGYKRPTSPEIDRLASSSVVFKRAYAAAPNTPRSIPSILTSRYPSQIPWRSPANYPPLPKGISTLAEDLEAAGYRNHAILTHWYFRRERGLARGFHTWDTSLVDDDIETGREESAPRVTEKARRIFVRAKAAAKPFFLWVHYFEPHHFYVLHKDSPTFGTAMMDKYDHEIRFVDREVGRLLKHLDESALTPSTTVILTSDHGEAFGEHAKYWHGHALYDEQLRVPLIVRAPHLNLNARTIDDVASLVDLRPTIAELAGTKPRGAMAGLSLVGALRGEPLAERTVFAEILPQPNYSAHQRMMLRGPWKLIEDLRMRSIELYDLATDSRELKNEATRSRTVVDQLRRSTATLNGTHP